MGLPLRQGWSIPASQPFYPLLPAVYRNVRMQMVFFQADRQAVQEQLPDPLEAAADGACVACGMAVPFCSNYGAFQEAFLQEKCVFRGQSGWYCSHVFHDGPIGIAAGREIYGTPKVYAGIEIQLADRLMSTVAHLGELPVITIASTMEVSANPAEVPKLVPSWRLKIIPRADRPEPALKQLIDAGDVWQDGQVHIALAGRGTVKFDANPLCDLTALAPKKILDAYYTEISGTETFAKVAFDYLVDI